MMFPCELAPPVFVAEVEDVVPPVPEPAVFDAAGDAVELPPAAAVAERAPGLERYEAAAP
jgi:hypothetical protein